MKAVSLCQAHLDGLRQIIKTGVVMSVPKYKPTKWDVCYCDKCKWATISLSWSCQINKHIVVPQLNTPFFIEDFKITGVGYKNWWKVESSQRNGLISPTEFEKIILGCGVAVNGHILNQWWMYCKKGNSLSLQWIK